MVTVQGLSVLNIYSELEKNTNERLEEKRDMKRRCGWIHKGVFIIDELKQNRGLSYIKVTEGTDRDIKTRNICMSLERERKNGDVDLN